MTQHSYPIEPPPVAVQAPRNGMGITALSLALVGLVFGLIPLTGFLAVILGALALVFGVVGISRARSGVATNRVMSWFGTLLGALALVIGVWGMVIVFQATGEFVREMDQISRDLDAPPPLPGQP